MTIRSAVPLAILLTVTCVATAGTRRLQAVAKESTITYRLSHPFHEVEAVSKDARCDIDADIDAKTIQDVTVKVDVTTFDSGNSNRDSHAMEVVDALTYPDASFKSTSVSQKGDSVFVDGALTFHGMTRDVRIAATTDWSAGRLTVTGGFDISLTAFHIERPALLLIPISDTLRFSFVQIFSL